MKCPNCQVDNSDKAKFCIDCGKPLQVETICPECGHENLPDSTFCNKCGQPLNLDRILKAWSKLAKKMGISANRLHSARHSHASLLLKQGAHPKVGQERLGQSTIMVTLDIYSHVVPGLQEAAVQKFDEVLGSDIIP